MNPSAMHMSPDCQECGKRLIFTSKEWAVCPDGHGKLIPRKWVEVSPSPDDEPEETTDGME